MSAPTMPTMYGECPDCGGNMTHRATDGKCPLRMNTLDMTDEQREELAALVRRAHLQPAAGETECSYCASLNGGHTSACSSTHGELGVPPQVPRGSRLTKPAADAGEKCAEPLCVEGYVHAMGCTHRCTTCNGTGRKPAVKPPAHICTIPGFGAGANDVCYACEAEGVSDEDLTAFINFVSGADIGPLMITAVAIAEDLRRLRARPAQDSKPAKRQDASLDAVLGYLKSIGELAHADCVYYTMAELKRLRGHPARDGAPAETGELAGIIRHLSEIRERMLARGEYITGQWADVADATTIADAIALLRAYRPAMTGEQIMALRQGAECCRICMKDTLFERDKLESRAATLEAMAKERQA